MRDVAAEEDSRLASLWYYGLGFLGVTVGGALLGFGEAAVTLASTYFFVLFLFGTGPVKGFAVTLSLGIVTSMFTAIMGTRSVINLIYGGRKRVEKLSI